MNSIEINIANLNNQTHIYIDIRNMQMKTNNELKEIYNFINKILNDIQKSLIYFKKTANEKDYYILPQEPATLLSEFLDAFYESKEKI